MAFPVSCFVESEPDKRPLMPQEQADRLWKMHPMQRDFYMKNLSYRWHGYQLPPPSSATERE